MNLVRRLRADPLLDRVVRNSAHLFSGNAAGLILSVVQSILAARLLGAAGYGVVGIVMGYASTVNGLLSFRMAEAIVRYGGEFLEKGEKKKAAAVIKASSLAELGASTIAFLVVALTATLASRFAAKTPGTEWMFLLYAMALLFNFNVETATGVLQITGKIRVRGTLNLIQAAFSSTIILAAYLRNEAAEMEGFAALGLVLAAYLLGKVILGLGLFASAWSAATRALGIGWPAVPLAALPAPRKLLGFALSSNLSATAILLFRESEVLWIGLLLNAEAAGLYKVAYNIVILLSVPADPLILSVYPEANRLVVQRAWRPLKQFLARVTGLSFLYNMLLAVGLVVAGPWILGIFGPEYTEAYPALLVLLAGVVFNYTFFWNRPLLLSFGLQKFALAAIIAAGLIKLTLAIPLVPRLGYVMEAGLLSTYFVMSVGLMAWRGLRELRERMALPPEPALS